MRKSKMIALASGVLVTLSMVAGSMLAASTDATKPVGNPVLSGVVTAIQGTDILIDAQGVQYSVDASGAKIQSINTPQGAAPTVTTLNLSDIKVGEKLKVRGTMSGSNVIADSIVDKGPGGGSEGGNAPKGKPGEQPQGAPGGQGPDVAAGLLVCTSNCENTGRVCISEVENGLKKTCDQKAADCHTACDNNNYNDATQARACYATCGTTVETPCRNEVVAKESACTTTKDQCVTTCQKSAKKEGKVQPQGPNDNQNMMCACPQSAPTSGKQPGQKMNQPAQEMGQQPQRPPLSDAAKAAIANSDYDAWVKAMDPMPAPLKVITKDNFPTYVEAYNDQTQAQDLMQKSKDLMKSLGINDNAGPEGMQPQKMQKGPQGMTPQGGTNTQGPKGYPNQGMPSSQTPQQTMPQNSYYY